MNPRTDYEEADTTTARAYVTLFKRIGDKFRFSIDSDVDPIERAEPMLITDDTEYDRSTIGFVTVDDKELYNEVLSEVVDMGLEILVEDTVTDESDGETHTLYTFKAYAPEDIDREWDVPHLIVYGWLRPELEEVLAGTFHADVEYEDVRNHYIVYGEKLEEEPWVDISTAISRHGNFFDDTERDLISDVRTSDYI